MKTYTGIIERRSGQAGSLGFPTINIPFSDTEVSGIYAAHAVVGPTTYEAAAYADPKRHTLEAHILDFSGVLDELTVTITLLKKMREDRTFTSTIELQQTIAQDVATIREYFAQNPIH